MSAASARAPGGPRLLIVDPSVADREAEGARTVAAAWPGRSRVALPVLEPKSGPAPGTGYDDDAIVVMGSRASVHDSLDWLDALSNWLRPVLRGEIDRPLLGLCFGHQLIASLVGGAVADVRPDGKKVVCYTETLFSPGRLVADARSIPVVASHRECVVRMPRSFRVTARRENSPIDAFEHLERPLFGVQFHPEAGAEFAGRAGLDPAGLTPRLRECNDEFLGSFAREAIAWLSR